MKVFVVAIILAISCQCFVAGLEAELEAQLESEMASQTGVDVTSMTNGFYVLQNRKYSNYLSILIDWDGYKGDYDIRGSFQSQVWRILKQSKGWTIDNGVRYVGTSTSAVYDTSGLSDIYFTMTYSGGYWCIKGVDSGKYINLMRRTNENNWYVYNGGVSDTCGEAEQWRIATM